MLYYFRQKIKENHRIGELQKTGTAFFGFQAVNNSNCDLEIRQLSTEQVHSPGSTGTAVVAKDLIEHRTHCVAHRWETHDLTVRRATEERPPQKQLPRWLTPLGMGGTVCTPADHSAQHALDSRTCST